MTTTAPTLRVGLPTMLMPASLDPEGVQAGTVSRARSQARHYLEEHGQAVAGSLLLALNEGWLSDDQIIAALTDPVEILRLSNEVTERIASMMEASAGPDPAGCPLEYVVGLHCDSILVSFTEIPMYLETDWSGLHPDLSRAMYLAAFALGWGVAPALVGDAAPHAVYWLGESVDAFRALDESGGLSDLRQAFDADILSQTDEALEYLYTSRVHDPSDFDEFVAFIEHMRELCFVPEWATNTDDLPQNLDIVVQALLVTVARWRHSPVEGITGTRHYRWLRRAVLLLRRFYRHGLHRTHQGNGPLFDEGVVPLEYAILIGTGWGTDMAAIEDLGDQVTNACETPTMTLSMDPKRLPLVIARLRALGQGLGLWRALASLDANEQPGGARYASGHQPTNGEQ